MNEIIVDFSDLGREAETNVLGTLIARFDPEFAAEVQAIVEIWAQRNARAESGEEIGAQMMRERTAAEAEALAHAIAKHRAHLDRA